MKSDSGKFQTEDSESNATGTGSPSASVVVCTRNRGALIVGAVRSILDANSPFEELIIIDQSFDEETANVAKEFASDGRLRYVKIDTVGTARARSAGLNEAKGDIVAYTDDDCSVSPNWLDAHRSAFLEHSKVILTFGAVHPADYNPAEGYIPAYTPSSDRHVKTFADKCQARGIGANMAIRRQEALAIGGFDLSFGSGEWFRSCEEGDLALRTLMAGYEIYETASSDVLHFGYRTWEAGRKHTSGDWFGIGAMCAKPLRCGCWKAWPVAYEEGVNRALLPFLRAGLTGARPLGVSRVVGFAKGFAAGLRAHFSKENFHYISPR